MPPRFRKMVGRAAALGTVFAVWSGLSGCQGDVTIVGTGGGASTAVGATTGDSATTGDVTSSSASTGPGTSGSGGAGPVDATITQITTGVIPIGVEVKLGGVVAMSRKFLVSQGNTGTCLWGVYVSEPNLAETKPGSGIVLTNYGLNGKGPPGGGGAFICPKLGQDLIGDAIPDDTKPGDVLDVLGETAGFFGSQCPSDPGLKSPRLSKVTSVIKTGTAPLPTPYTMSAAELAKLVPPGNPAFQAQWQGVKIKIHDVVSQPQSTGPTTSIVDKFGVMLVHDASIPGPTDVNLPVGSRLDGFGFQASSFCFGAPTYSNLTTTFYAIEGIGAYDSFPPCNWVFQTTNRCLDFSPPSDDCANPLACD